ncbi:MAG TPA: cyclohexanone monooxygenase, partial [Casimicrobiaceae bacterium]|nr:cyclohexanone monooxygenase [Casimicrobiaceae bacterium]
MDDTPEQRECTYTERWQKGGVRFMAAYNDLALNQTSNDTAADFVRARICEIVRDPMVAELLCPKDYPIGTKRICVDTNYFATFNR